MNRIYKQQTLWVVIAIIAVVALYFGGKTVSTPKSSSIPASPASHEKTFDFEAYISSTIKALSPSRQQYLLAIENKVKRGSVKQDKISALMDEASFWKDTMNNPLAYFHALSKGATLENSEKSLTFAAHSILNYLPYVDNIAQREGLANMGRKLFETALQQNSKNDSSTIGLGACYIYGAREEGKAETPMAGIMKIREVVQRDSNNIFGQYMLGVGGLVSGQLDKAVIRFEKVVKAQPNNLEALFKLAETYESLGDKLNAIKWYQVILNKSNIPEMKKELEQRIQQLKQ